MFLGRGRKLEHSDEIHMENMKCSIQTVSCLYLNLSQTVAAELSGITLYAIALGFPYHWNSEAQTHSSMFVCKNSSGLHRTLTTLSACSHLIIGP